MPCPVALLVRVRTASPVGRRDRLGLLTQCGGRAAPGGCFLVRRHLHPGDRMLVGKLGAACGPCVRASVPNALG